MQKVLVGMSGGIDSSVTAYLLRKKGYEVEGVSFLLCEETGETASSCCSGRGMDEASETAHHLGISHHLLDVRSDFRGKVIEPFLNAYLSGSTPNPCVLCNRFIKFPHLMSEADKRGAAYIATGHYARVEPAKKGKEQRAESKESDFSFLRKGVDSRKDQSYVLYILEQDILRKLLLPLGDYRKDTVRKMAQDLGLPAAHRPESQEICFIEGRNYLAFIDRLSPYLRKPGPILDLNGKKIGTHKGISGYTIGQRKGMGISSPEPLYVIDIDTGTNTIIAGYREAAEKREFFVAELNWLVPPVMPSVGEDGEELQFRATVKVRSTMKDQPATIYRAKSKEQRAVRVVFDEPQWAPAPGQSAVFYNGEMVIGGGVIKRPA
jgi:tRNA-specific 2-thiouridylase